MPRTTGASATTFNEDEYILQARLVKDSLLTLSLLGPLYGVLAVLSVLSVRSLMQRTRRTIAIICLTIFALFTSTTVAVVTYTLSTQYSFLNIIKNSTHLIEYPATLTDHLPLHNCASTAALTINITLGDAIVCWRACVIWQKNIIVRTVCIILVLVTFALGIVETFMGCRLVALIGPYASTSTLAQIGDLYDGVPVGIAACVVSLTTNLMATLLVAYKAWRSRRRLRGYLLAGSQVGKLFALLIECGAIYCVMWVLSITFQVAENDWTIQSSSGPASAAGRTFLDVFGVTLGGSSVPVVALYPMVIIVLVAHDRSHIERGLSNHIEAVPTPRLAITVPISESAQYRRSEVLVIGLDSDSEGPGYLDGTKASARKPEPIV